MILELHVGQWRLIASTKDDEPVTVRPFDALTFSLVEAPDFDAPAPGEALRHVVEHHLHRERDVGFDELGLVLRLRWTSSGLVIGRLWRVRCGAAVLDSGGVAAWTGKKTG